MPKKKTATGLPASWTPAERAAAKTLQGIKVAKVPPKLRSEKAAEIKRAVKEYFSGEKAGGRSQAKR
jgi:hypothetical protein